MPELPEVETVMRGLEKTLLNRSFSSITLRRKDLRFPIPPALPKLFTGEKITGFERRAKYILIHFAHGHSLLLHLGMSGRIVIDDGKDALHKHDHVVFTTDRKTRLRFNDARRFGLLDMVETAKAPQHKLLHHLGLEPLAKNFTGAALHAAFKNSKTPVKIALMDQSRIVGVGNIYASEALFGAGISPKRVAHSLSQAEAGALAKAVRAVLKRAIKKGGSSLRDYVQTDGEMGYFQHEFSVYGRKHQPCPTCKKTILHTVQGGRATFYCGNCQK